MQFDHEQILHHIENLERKIDVVQTSVEKIRKYFLAMVILAVVMFIVPLIGLAFAIPAFLNTYLGSFEGLL